MELLGKIFGVLLLVSVRNLSECAQSGDETEQNAIQKNVDKPRTLYDYQTRVVAYKDLIDPKCLLEILTNEESIISQRLANFGNRTSNLKPISTTNQLSKREIWRLAGTRISDFCRGFPTYLIQNTLPETQNTETLSYIQNDLPMVEISSKIRKKREERRYFVGRVRGQTQSQYLNFGKQDGQPGKAEAESSVDGTKAVVTGTSGMGQAQSQSSPVDCGECLGSGLQDQTLLFGRQPGGQVPEKITRPEYPRGSLRPGETYPGGAPGFSGEYRPDGGRLEQGSRGYPAGTGRPDEHELYYPSSTSRPGAEGPVSSGVPGYNGARFQPGEGYPPGIRPGEGDSGYPIGRPVEQNYPPSPAHLPQPGGTSDSTTGPRYPSGPGGPSGALGGRPGETIPGYHPGRLGQEVPGSGVGSPSPQPGTPGYFPNGGKLGEPGTGYPTPDIRPGDGSAHYPSSVARPGEIIPGRWVPGYPTSAGEVTYQPDSTRHPAGGERYTPGFSRPGDIGIGYPSVSERPDDHRASRPGEAGTTYPSGTPLAGQIATDSSGISRPVEETRRYPPGTFGGQLSGQYESHAGQSGKFSGSFHGTYEAGGTGVQPEGQGYGQGQFQKPGAVGGPEYHGPEYTGSYVPGQALPGAIPGYYPGRPSGTYPGASTAYPGTGGAPGSPEIRPAVPGYGPGPGELQKPGGGQIPEYRPGFPGGYLPEQLPSGTYARPYPTKPTEYQRAPTGIGSGQGTPGYGTGPGPAELQKPGPQTGTASRPGYPSGYLPGQGPSGTISGPYPTGTSGLAPGYVPGSARPSPELHPGEPGYSPGAGELQKPGTGAGPSYYPAGYPGWPAGYTPGIGDATPPVSGYPGGYVPGQIPTGTSTGIYPGGAAGGYQGASAGSGAVGPPGSTTSQYGSGYQPGIPAYSGQSSTRPGGPAYGPGGQDYGPGGQAYRPVGQVYGPGGQAYAPGGQAYGPGEQTYGPGQAYGPGGHVYGPGGQVYGPGGQVYVPGGPAYGPGGYAGGVPPGGAATGETYPRSQQAVPGGLGYPSAGTYGPGAIPGLTPSYGPETTGATGGGIPPGQYVERGPASGSGSGVGLGGQWGQTSGTADDADSQVQTSVQQSNNETIANAQAHGKFQGGTSQSQVSGTYSGSGSFSASAGSDDGKRGALTQVAGGKDGAQSSAQGRGGAGQSQAQVTLDSGSGDTLSSAQTSGIQHGTQTQVQASEKGGLADAQANGPGPTSSQAQIGFTPYDEQETDNQTTPFRGGGTAAAQSGTLSGMTQTQIQGKFRYGIRYQGAAQAGSGSTAIRNLTEPTGYFKPINFTANKISHNKQSQSQQSSITVPVAEKKLNSPPSETLTGSETSREVQKVDPVSQEDPVVVSTPGDAAADYDEQEYADEDYNEEASNEHNTEYPQHVRSPSRRNLEPPEIRQPVIPTQKIVSQTTDNQKQHIVLDPLEDLDATVHQSKGDFPEDGMVLQPGQVIPGSPGYQIPAGFRGRVKAIANGPNTFAIGKNSQAQSVTLSPGSGRIFYSKPSNPVYGVVTRTTYKNGNYGAGYSYQPIYQPVGYRVKSGKVLPNFVSVSKSEAGSTNPNTGKKTPDIYYTQSSSCGMFTNSCVYANGKKTCFPVRKTNPDGSPMSC